MRTRRTICAVSTAIPLSIAIGAFIWANLASPANATTSDPYRLPQIDAAQAVEAVRAHAIVQQPAAAGRTFQVLSLRTDDLVATGPMHGSFMDYFKVEGRDVSAMVDVHDGHVAQLLLLTATTSQAGSGFVIATDALAIGEAYAKAQGLDVGNTAPQVQFQDHGASTEYDLVWQRVVNGAEVPDFKLIQIDAATGRVFAFSDFRHPFTDPPTPAVSKNQAIADAEGLTATTLGYVPMRYTVDDSRLQVRFDSAGNQMLVWQVEISTTSLDSQNEYFIILVDAQSGVATIQGRG
jgi:hypothetical protein